MSTTKWPGWPGELPAGTVLVVTADHGMVDVPHTDRVDLAERPELADGVRVLGGEARFAQAYCEAGRATVVAARLADALGERAWVRTRDEAIDAGWFGPVDDRVRPRLGDVLIAGIGSFALVDARTATPHVLRLIGQHGSLTAAGATGAVAGAHRLSGQTSGGFGSSGVACCPSEFGPRC